MIKTIQPFYTGLSCQTAPQTLSFALSFLHFAPSFDVFQNELDKDYLRLNLESPQIEFKNGPKLLSRIEFQNRLTPSFVPSGGPVFSPKFFPFKEILLFDNSVWNQMNIF